MKYWRFPCNAGTRPQFLRRQLVRHEEFREVSPSDTVILYDYSENEVYGPMTAITSCEKKARPKMWRDKYPYEVRVAWDDLYRIKSSKYPPVESNNETLSVNEFREIVDILEDEGKRLILPEWGSESAAYVDDVVAEPEESEILVAQQELEDELDSEPPDSEPPEYETVERVARERAFRRAVRDAYSERCAVCGIRRETPDGRPEVEAAHIKPKSQGGPDDIRNGIALCRLHHWAFDNGWFSIEKDLTVNVRSNQERDGYAEFAALDGRELILPEQSKKHPSIKYLR